MAWELDWSSHQYLAPSILKASEAEPNAQEWLAERFADQRWKEETGHSGYDALKTQGFELSGDVLVQAIADAAIEYGSTTNGGHEVYLSSGYTIPWCNEEEMLSYYA